MPAQERPRSSSGSSHPHGSSNPSVSFFETARSPSDHHSRDLPAFNQTYGSTRSLPAYANSGSKRKLPFKIGKGGLRHAESTPPGQFPVYMDDKVLKQVRENTSKFIQQRITSVEKHFGDMCQGLGNYLRRLSKYRDSGDDLAKFITTYAEKETFNSSTKDSLVQFSSSFAAVQDYRDSQIQRLDNKVLGPLTVYGTECKHAKEKLKQAFTARNKEIKEQKNLNKARTNPGNRQGLSQAETDLQKANVDASRASKQLETEMEAFEKRKLNDIKNIFMDFVNVEMLFHARALEMYTQCWESLSQISGESDLEEFRNSLRPPSSQSRLDQMRTGSRTSLNTTGLSMGGAGSSSGDRGTPAGTPARGRRQPDTPNDTLNTTNRTSMYSETTQDDEYLEDGGDYDDEDDSENDTYAERFQRK